MGCVEVTHLRLTNTRFCVSHTRMNHCKAHLMFTSREADFKGILVVDIPNQILPITLIL